MQIKNPLRHLLKNEKAKSFIPQLSGSHCINISETLNIEQQSTSFAQNTNYQQIKCIKKFQWKMRKFRSVKDDRPFRNRFEQICIKHQFNFFFNWTAWKLPFLLPSNIPVFAWIKEFDIHAQRCAYIYAYICLQTKHCINCCHKFSCQDQIYHGGSIHGLPYISSHWFP